MLETFDKVMRRAQVERAVQKHGWDTLLRLWCVGARQVCRGVFLGVTYHASTDRYPALIEFVIWARMRPPWMVRAFQEKLFAIIAASKATNPDLLTQGLFPTVQTAQSPAHWMDTRCTCDPPVGFEPNYPAIANYLLDCGADSGNIHGIRAQPYNGLIGNTNRGTIALPRECYTSTGVPAVQATEHHVDSNLITQWM